MKTNKHIILPLVMVAVVTAVCWTGLHWIRVSRAYAVRAEFAHLPPNDERLVQWLSSQPGVVKALVDRDRRKPVIRVYWIMSQDLRNRPSAPKLSDNWVAFGYNDLVTVDWNWEDS